MGRLNTMEDLADKNILEEEKVRRVNTEDDLPAIVRKNSFEVKRQSSLKYLPQRTRMTGIFLNTLMGDTLMGDDDDDIDDITDTDDDEFFKDTDPKESSDQSKQQ